MIFPVEMEPPPRIAHAAGGRSSLALVLHSSSRAHSRLFTACSVAFVGFQGCCVGGAVICTVFLFLLGREGDFPGPVGHKHPLAFVVGGLFFCSSGVVFPEVGGLGNPSSSSGLSLEASRGGVSGGLWLKLVLVSVSCWAFGCRMFLTLERQDAWRSSRRSPTSLSVRVVSSICVSPWGVVPLLVRRMFLITASSFVRWGDEVCGV